MKRFKEYKNLILSMCSLTATLLLLIVCVLGWYVTNKQAYVTGVVGSTSAVGCDVTLSYYDEDSGVFKTADEISFTEMQPDDVFYFKLTCKSSGGPTNLNFLFDGIKSSLNKTFSIKNDRLCVENGAYNIPIYDLNDNNNVIVNDKVLYTYDSTSSTFSLGDYLIEDTILFYDLGDSWTTPPAVGELTGKSIKNPQYVINIDNEESNHYFAIEFNDLLSTIAIESINGEDVDTVIENSNLFLYQKFEIENVYYSID